MVTWDKMDTANTTTYCQMVGGASSDSAAQILLHFAKLIIEVVGLTPSGHELVRVYVLNSMWSGVAFNCADPCCDILEFVEHPE